MSLLSRRRFSTLAMLSPLLPFASHAAEADLIESLLAKANVPRHDDELWVLIDDGEASLTVYRGNRQVERFSPVSLGRGGARTARQRGDKATPMGEFRVNRFNRESQWHIFIGLDYPTPAHARMALKSGIYTERDYDDYFTYYKRYGHPPQETVLGGYIGIHGLGGADPDIHASYHWTQGCVAVTNAQIERLESLIDIGTRVVIR
ncbi:L,D-transpeptidase family protein [Billgrantia gudaonensis]|uniref:L,D-transpeptidase catalytic domain n=1 Tax=Billgrantia gudaonensis TaxID=376427 RepID=A0A1G8TCJ7_9GAMM|nr:L,D-transpeptidase [Halomonas gudaonensis]SDJ39228.1 L,D-transpeptidase catalytic domain [Halomonas gudaonensis]